MRSTRDLITGPPPVLPAALDQVAERWAAAPPRLRWGLVGAVAVLVLALMGRGATRSPWGPPVEVVVAATELSPGHRVGPADLTTATWPRDLAARAATRTEDVVGRITTRRLVAGAPIPHAAVHDGGVAASLPRERAAVPIASDTSGAVTAGWWVDVVGRGVDGVADVLARDARVLAVVGERVWLAVDRDEAPNVAAASARGDAGLVLLAPT